MTTKLTDTQTAVLIAAADEPSGRIAWFPESVKGGARTKVLQGLVTRGLAKAVGDGHRLTATGYAAIGRTRPEAKKTAARGAQAGEARAPRRTRENTKQAAMLALLGRPKGTTIAELVETTGWQQHSVRGALVNLAKHLGITIGSEKTDGVRIYRIAA
ncbi:MAG: DUF3489 domain-containing protein [Gammaproteobacteria bacterium]